ncbi:MAG TPA: aminopeptidase [Kiritimatiellia bacterium]|nr:aminopeptidase [Kiritimatiellia bacterium]
MSKSFNLLKLLHDVFAPDEHDIAIVMVDEPTERDPDSSDWQDRRGMAVEWLDGLEKIGVQTQPLLRYAATGANNGDLPSLGIQDGVNVPIEKTLSTATLVIAMTRYSATAPLSMLTRKYPTLRAASMPNVLKRMEKSALAADYMMVAKKATMLSELLNHSEFADVIFSTGDKLRFDLRFRSAHADDGMCRRDKTGFRVINLPSGEAFIVPYEGEKPGVPSETAGTIPLAWKGSIYTLHVLENRISEIKGEGSDRDWLQRHFDVDPARRNIAELGLGCNDRAIITGNVLEDEKAGFHWAYGRSEHLGGTVSPQSFSDSAHVVHHDVVYAKGCPIEIARLELEDGKRDKITVIRDGIYVDALFE